MRLLRGHLKLACFFGFVFWSSIGEVTRIIIVLETRYHNETLKGSHPPTLGNMVQKSVHIQDVAFHKKRALTIDAMVKSRWVYRKGKTSEPA